MLKNAIDSISIGIEDLWCKDERRVSSALRNIFAGILLLYKEHLRQLSPEDSNDVLIKSDLRFSREEGQIVVTGTGKRTVDVGQIIQRYSQLGLPIDQRAIERLQSMRNQLEHDAPKETPEQIQTALAESMHLIEEAMGYLELEPREHFDSKIWAFLLQESSLGESRRKACRESREELEVHPDIRDEFLGIECPACDSDLVCASGDFPDDFDLTCQFCGEELTTSEVFADLVSQKFGISEYELAKDGGIPLIDICSSCQVEVFYLPKSVCLLCRETLKTVECGMCGTGLDSVTERENGACSGCSYGWEKAMWKD